MNEDLIRRLKICTSLPTPPSTAVRIIELANSPNASLMQIGGGQTIVLNGTPDFSTAFIGAYRLSAAIVFSLTFVGAATGVRYRATLNSVVETNGGGAAYLPGDAAGALIAGAQYS